MVILYSDISGSFDGNAAKYMSHQNGLSVKSYKLQHFV